MIPSTNLKLLHYVDIANDYAHTFSWGDMTHQVEFFLSKVEVSFTDFSYQYDKKAVRVGMNADVLNGKNYIMFQNSNYTNKWFYAFITSVEFVSQAVSLIYFEIDVWQSFYFDISWRNCFVEREHVTDDTRGSHLINENLDVGNLIVTKRDHFGSVVEGTDLSNLCVIIASTYNPYTKADVSAKVYTGIYSGAGLFMFNLSNLSGIDSFISTTTTDSKIEAIVAMFMFPKNMIQDFTDGGLIPSGVGNSLSFTFEPNATIDGYTPKNNKLLCYPYNFVYVVNGNNATGVYRIEDFNNNECTFSATVDLAVNPTVILSPQNYMTPYANFSESLALTQFPFCMWTYDTFKDYIAKNIVSAPLALVGSVVSAVAGAATGNAIGVASGILGVANTIGGFVEKSMLANQSKGALQGSSAISVSAQSFIFFQKCLRHETAEIIDGYFEMYGYKVMKIKTPNIRSRTRWNYLKTIETNIFADIPMEHLSKLKSTLLNGITFWHDDIVSQYGLTNAVR